MTQLSALCTDEEPYLVEEATSLLWEEEVEVTLWEEVEEVTLWEVVEEACDVEEVESGCAATRNWIRSHHHLLEQKRNTVPWRAQPEELPPWWSSTWKP
jgi:hypothetical protein